MKPIIISKSLSNIHEVPANSVANKDNVQVGKKRMEKKLMPAPVTIQIKRKAKEIHPELEVDTWNRTFKGTPGRNLQKIGSLVFLSNHFSPKSLKSRIIPKKNFIKCLKNIQWMPLVSQQPIL
jgi:hypothetical protein